MSIRSRKRRRFAPATAGCLFTLMACLATNALAGAQEPVGAAVGASAVTVPPAAGTPSVSAGEVSAPAASPAEVSAAPATAEAQPGDPAATVYMTKCMGCHTIGGGALTGPDLKNAASYPTQTVVDAVKRMEKNVGPLKDPEVEELVAFITDPAAGERVKAQQQLAALKEAASLEPASAEKGRALFLGAATFQNGGVSCAACHQAGGRGGNLAASLEDAFTRLGEQSLMATAQSPGFPVMRAVYATQPVTKQEALHLVKFFEEVSKAPASPAKVPLHLAGVAGTVAVMLLLGGATHKRAAGTRARMVAEAQRRTDRRSHSRRNG